MPCRHADQGWGRGQHTPYLATSVPHMYTCKPTSRPGAREESGHWATLRGTHLQGLWHLEVPRAIAFLPSPLSEMDQENCCQNAAVLLTLSPRSAGQTHPPVTLLQRMPSPPGTLEGPHGGTEEGQLHPEQEVESEPECPTLVAG